jgi:peptidoglycan/LPS O-acetylase OafA/YrhL
MRVPTWRPARRVPLAVAAGLLFLVALGLSWSGGADHLTLQLLAMALGLVACLLVAMAAGFGRRDRHS